MNNTKEIIFLMDSLLKMSNEEFEKYRRELLRQTDNDPGISELLAVVSSLRGVGNV